MTQPLPAAPAASMLVWHKLRNGDYEVRLYPDMRAEVRFGSIRGVWHANELHCQPHPCRRCAAGIPWRLSAWKMAELVAWASASGVQIVKLDPFAATRTPEAVAS